MPFVSPNVADGSYQVISYHTFSWYDALKIQPVTENTPQVGKLPNQQIADKLFISLQTVKDHNHHIFRKTGVRNRMQLARIFGFSSGEKKLP